MTCRNPQHVPCDCCNGTGQVTEANLTNLHPPGDEQCWACCGSGCRSLATTDLSRLLDVPAADTDTQDQPECRGFWWLGQPFTSCDNCGRPAWEHDGMHEPPRDDPFSGDPGHVRPWAPGEAEAIRAKWDTP